MSSGNSAKVCRGTVFDHAGSGAQNAELSFRLKRKDIEEVHGAGDDQYYDAVDEVIHLCDLLHDERWDQDAVAHAADMAQF